MATFVEIFAEPCIPAQLSGLHDKEDSLRFQNSYKLKGVRLNGYETQESPIIGINNILSSVFAVLVWKNRQKKVFKNNLLMS